MASKHAIGRITINGLLWAFVEWSYKRECWCIEDCRGRCLLHEENLRGQEASAEAAAASAIAMIADGRMPAPSVQAAERQRRREQRNRQPAEIRRREAQERKYTLMRAQADTNPLLQVLDEERQLAEWCHRRRRVPLHVNPTGVGVSDRRPCLNLRLLTLRVSDQTRRFCPHRDSFRRFGAIAQSSNCRI
jgi:hypothetical protein